MKRLILFLSLFFILLNGCVVYTEKQSEALSEAVYATRDSINAARIDLASQYITNVTALVVPPKKEIKINPIYEDETFKTNALPELKLHSSKPKKTSRIVCQSPPSSKRRVVILPESYKNDKVVSVNSSEYDELIKNKKIAEQLKTDNQNLANENKRIKDEVKSQKDMKNKMIDDLNYYQKEVYKLRLAVLWRNIVIVTIVLIIASIIYVKASKPIPFL